MLSELRYRLARAAAVLPTLLPSSCALCAAHGREALCDDCRGRFFGPGPRRCRQCALPLPHATGDNTVCGECLRSPPAFDATIAAADYAPPLDQLVLALKFGGRLALAPLFARMMRDAVASASDRGDPLPTLLVAVPLGRQRLAERGFNQAHEMARPLSRSLGIPVAARLVVRRRDTIAQSLLHPDERHDNIRDAFDVQEMEGCTVEGAHVGVVDDVMTTGQTLGELAATLKRFGAARVTNLVFARTPLK
jgi:ComF family protein